MKVIFAMSAARPLVPHLPTCERTLLFDAAAYSGEACSASSTASETVTRHGREPRRLLLCPLPLRERAPPQFNTTDWVRGSLEPLTRPYLLNIQRCPLPQGERAQ